MTRLRAALVPEGVIGLLGRLQRTGKTTAYAPQAKLLRPSRLSKRLRCRPHRRMRPVRLGRAGKTPAENQVSAFGAFDPSEAPTLAAPVLPAAGQPEPAMVRVPSGPEVSPQPPAQVTRAL